MLLVFVPLLFFPVMKEKFTDLNEMPTSLIGWAKGGKAQNNNEKNNTVTAFEEGDVNTTWVN
jgi:hypothetical protein